MFPLSADKLSFLKIADYWSRESPASQDELLAELEAAWWLGEIIGNSARTRLQFLENMYRSRHEPHLQSVVFVTPSDPGPPAVTPLPNGEVVADVRPRISVPSETDDWSENSYKDAFLELARLPSQQYFPLLSYSICFIELTSEEFFGWVARRGFEVPKFWKRIAEATQTSPQGSDASNNSHSSFAVNTSGRGTKGRAIQNVLKYLFPKGVPAGMTSERRNELIWKELERKGIGPKPHKRTIERAIKDLTKED
jgi:hypothetical protein